MFLDPDASKENLKIPQDTSQKKSRAPKPPKKNENGIQYLTNSGQSLKQFWNRKTLTKMLKKEAQIQPFFLFFKILDTSHSLKFNTIKTPFCNTFWTSLFAQKTKKIYKRTHDKPKKARRNFKESKISL